MYFIQDPLQKSPGAATDFDEEDEEDSTERLFVSPVRAPKTTDSPVFHLQSPVYITEEDCHGGSFLTSDWRLEKE